MSSKKELIEKGKIVLGIEFGSTRIKAVLIDENHHPIASGDHEWENRLENGIWTYSLDDIWQGLRDSYQKLAFNVEDLWSDFKENRSDWVQCHDAWLYGI